MLVKIKYLYFIVIDRKISLIWILVGEPSEF
jgi:hypothetical protein